MVAGCYWQIHGQDYKKTYTPIIRSDISRILLDISAKLEQKIKQFDIHMTFLHGPIYRHLYITQLQGFEQRKKLVCLLNIALYGLVQSKYLWFGDIKTTLEDFGFTQLKHEDVLFYNISHSLYITVYVDDIKVFCLDDTNILILKKYLQSKYNLKDIGHMT